ncbi:hypothetical protein FQA39_LY14300 [Lamprigera yunnana]|nr:hypothetical protein FQA39_LY14300 [Lamprigera yunnana]
MPDYIPAEEACLILYNNASNEVLVDVILYALDGDADKYIETGYSTCLKLEAIIRIQDGCGDFGCGKCQTLLNKNSVLLMVDEWKTLMGHDSYLTNQFFRDSIEIQPIVEQSFKDDLSVPNIGRIAEEKPPQRDPSASSYVYQYFERYRRVGNLSTNTHAEMSTRGIQTTPTISQVKSTLPNKERNEKVMYMDDNSTP